MVAMAVASGILGLACAVIAGRPVFVVTAIDHASTSASAAKTPGAASMDGFDLVGRGSDPPGVDL